MKDTAPAGGGDDKTLVLVLSGSWPKKSLSGFLFYRNHLVQTQMIENDYLGKVR